MTQMLALPATANLVKETVPSEPLPLINQQDWYLLRQLEKFSSGQRHHFDGYDPEKLSKEDLDGVISWIAQLH